MGHHEERGDGGIGGVLDHGRIVVIAVEDAEGRRHAGGIGGLFARVADGDLEAERREQRGERRADVARADHDDGRDGADGLDEDLHLSAAAHAEAGTETEGLDARGEGEVAEGGEHREEHGALDGAAADRAEGGALVEQDELLSRGGGGGAVTRDDGGEDDALAPLGREGGGAQDLVRGGRARHQRRGGHGAEHSRAPGALAGPVARPSRRAGTSRRGDHMAMAVQ